MYGPDNVNCGLRSFLTMTIVPLVAANISLRLMIFFFLSKLSKEMNQLQNNEELPEARKAGLCQRLFNGVSDMCFATYALVLPSNDQTNRVRLIQALSFVASPKGTVVVVLIFIIPFFAVALGLVLSDQTYVRCSGCRLVLVEVIELIAVGVVFILITIFAAVKVRHIPDPWGIKQEAIGMCFFGVIILIGFLLNRFADPAPSSTYDHQVIIITGFIGYVGVQTVYQVFAAYRAEKSNFAAKRALQAKRAKKKQQREIRSVADESATQTNMTDGRMDLFNVLQNPELCTQFEKFLVAELGIESLLFLRAVEEWKKGFFDIAPSARVARARRLYNTFVSPSGSFPVNIPSDMITAITSDVMSDDSSVCRQDTFDSAYQEVVDLLQLGALWRFQNSQEFSHYLSDRGVKGGRVESRGAGL